MLAHHPPNSLLPSKSIFPSLFVSDSPNISSISSSVTGSPVIWRIVPNSSLSTKPSPFLCVWVYSMYHLHCERPILISILRNSNNNNDRKKKNYSKKMNGAPINPSKMFLCEM